MKAKRQAMILELIKGTGIKTQDDLIKGLKAHGFEVTQATVSRDIRELNLVKSSDGAGGYRYMSVAPTGDDFLQKLTKIFAEAVHKVDYAQNIVVIKTYAGMGNAAGAAVDSMHLEGVVGSLAGDDTLLIIARNDEAANRICTKLKLMLSQN